MRASLPTVALLAVAATACGRADAQPETGAAATADDARVASVAAAPAAPRPPILVYKTATCGCCEGWVEHLRAAGFEVDARDTNELASIKRDAGVTSALASCHTAIIGGYVVEGHVPAEVIDRLLAEHPDIKGIAVPGMPAGSPGMEGPNARPYQVIAFDHQGGTSVYAEIDPR